MQHKTIAAARRDITSAIKLATNAAIVAQLLQTSLA